MTKTSVLSAQDRIGKSGISQKRSIRHRSQRSNSGGSFDNYIHHQNEYQNEKQNERLFDNKIEYKKYDQDGVQTERHDGSIALVSKSTRYRKALSRVWLFLTLSFLTLSSFVATPDVIAAPAKRATLNEALQGNFGWRYGSKKHRNELRIRVPYSKSDLLFHVQGYDIGGGEVTIFVNGRPLGNLLLSNKKEFNQPEIWWIPRKMQRRKGNVIRLVNNRPGGIWGVRRLGVYVAGSKHASFGSLGKIGGDETNSQMLRVIVPEGSKDNRIRLRYFDLNNNAEIGVFVGGRRQASPKPTGAGKWSGNRLLPIPENRRIIVDFYHNENSRRSRAMRTWGVRFMGLDRHTTEPEPIRPGNSNSGGGSSGSGSTGSSSGGGSSGSSSTGSSSGGNSSGSGSTGSSSGGNSSGSGSTGSSSGSGGNSSGSGSTGSSSGGNSSGSGSTGSSSSGGNSSGSGSTGSSGGSGGSGSGGSSSSGGATGPGGGSLLGLPTVSGLIWDEAAVRRVLMTFAYGGYPTGRQIQNWALMHPRDAIKQILTLDEHNLRLSPRSTGDKDNLTGVTNSFAELSKLWTSNSGNNRTPNVLKREHRMDFFQLQRLWVKSITARGLNPVRNKIGLWETNYHMAVNHHAGVYGPQLGRYYDDILKGHQNNEPYEKIIARAAQSAAVAEQYKHKENTWVNGQCECNEDFAREFHQLFFGILGKDNRRYHETVTIKNTAKVLTDMHLPWRPDLVAYSDQVNFGTARHHVGDLDILNRKIAGQNAKTKISNLASVAINHPESLDHLPVIIIRDLADDKLTPAKEQKLRNAWRSMPQKRLLEFLQAYAVSTLFHDRNRVKYWTSIERHMLLTTRMILNNEEAHIEIYDPIFGGYLDETTPIFAPKHNVFGHQTGIEASRSTDVFRTNYNRLTRDFPRYQQVEGSGRGRTFRKDWTKLVPKSSDGSYRVKDVAPWLWNHMIGDGLKNFGDLERATVYAFLAGPNSLQYLLDKNNMDRVITSNDIRSDPGVRTLVQELGNKNIELSSPNRRIWLKAQKSIGSAINFIGATPYMFAQEGR